MAGHSKWANIKHRKAAQDKKRGKLYTTLIREITVAARLGGGDADSNPRLRAAVDKALGANMPKDTVERAVARGAGGGEGADVEELVYEGYAPGGVAILVEAMTDNRNRTVAEVRHAFTKYGGNLGTDGSVAYLFNRRGVINFAPGADEDQVMEIALEAGADDIDAEDDGALSVLTPWERLSDVVAQLKAGDLEPDHAEVTMLADTYNSCDVEAAEKVLRLIDALEDLDDVQNVYSNGEFPDSALAG
ncbi:MAG: YebC/PmpR family DNA-binding transcriptional regulator [Gammaproteobacteria bacterium]|nr:YebC/PmpR family DNA-binding transcriptional regulator [Gammaproteobacteria bacterium]|tara:strand:+ start:1500 stop:2240 length:741 start_codon:yes stop_codon:yes gene_type:complete